MFKSLLVVSTIFISNFSFAAADAVSTHAADLKPSYPVKIISHKEEFPLTEEVLKRYLAAEADESDVIWYYTNFNKQEAVEKIDLGRWESFKAKNRARWDYFLKFYYANTRAKSNTGKEHIACFTGNIDNIATDFFDHTKIDFMTGLTVSKSSDRKMMGVEFNCKVASGNCSGHFRIPHCFSSGKTTLIDLDHVKIVSSDKEFARMPAADAVAPVTDQRPDDAKPVNPAEQNAKGPVAAAGGGTSVGTSDSVPSDFLEINKLGFEVEDRIEKPFYLIDGKKIFAKDLHQFKTNVSIDGMTPEKDQPWHGMDVGTVEGAEKFALTVQQYFYQDMMNPLDPEKNFDSTNSKKWCNMPWLQPGPSGRDYVHGLTKEHDLSTSAIYPSANGSEITLGSDWGVAYFNTTACQGIKDIFGTRENPKQDELNFRGVKFPMGSMAVKILFSTAVYNPKTKTNPWFQGAFQWLANVSLSKQTERQVRKVSHIQMDIAVKDDSLVGASPDANHWVMTSYYYDLKYNTPLKLDFPKHSEGLKHMRPIGVAVGFDSSTSKIVAGSATNNAKLMVNGPADKSSSSCMGCHGAAGTKEPMVPGVPSYARYKAIRNNGLDFSMQVAFAKRYYQTRVGQK